MCFPWREKKIYICPDCGEDVRKKGTCKICRQIRREYWHRFAGIP